MLPQLLLLLLPSLSHALYSPKGSPCAVECATTNSNFTGTSDLVCQDTAYDDDSDGNTLKSCISCLGKSDYVNSSLPSNGNSDQWWFLWHIKYVQQYCLVDTPQTAAASSCASKCSTMKDVLDVSWVYAGAQPQYAYCGWNSSQYTQYANDCASCLQEQEGGVIIGNFADTMYRACSSQPLAAQGQLISTARDLFDTATVTASATRSASATTSAATNTGTSTAGSITSSTATPTASASSSGLSSGASIGIGVGVGIAVVAVVIGSFFFFRRRRSSAARKEDLIPPPQYPAQEMGGHPEPYKKYNHERSNMAEVEARNVWPAQELDATGRR